MAIKYFNISIEPLFPINMKREKMKTQIIKTVIIIFLLLIAAVNVILVVLITNTSQLFPYENKPVSTINTQSINPSSNPAINPTPLDNISPTTQAETPTTLFIPLLSHDRQVPDVRSPFSLQIAALHQVSTNVFFLSDGTYAIIPAETESSTAEESSYGYLAAALKDSGADWTRVRVEWELIEPNTPVPGQQPEYDWQYHDENLRVVADTGVRIIATLSDSPSWAASSPCAPIYTERLDEFGRYLTDLVNRYKEPPFYIRHWELVNEPDSNRYTFGDATGHGCWAYDGDQYAKMLAVAYKAIKEADPRAKVLMGGIAYDWFEEYGGPFYRYFSDDVMVNGGGSYIDAFNFHFFTDFRAEWDRWNPNSQDRLFGWIPAPSCGTVDDGMGTSYDVEGFDIIAKTTHFRNRMNACYGVSKPVWVTEVAGHGYADDQETLIAQAQYVIKVYARALSAGVQNITWFSLDQPPYDPHGQALLNPDFSPKPAYFAYQTLTSELDGFYQYSHDRNTCLWGSAGVSCYVEAYVFMNDSGEEKTVAWGSTRLPFQANQVRVVDRDGNETIIADGGAGDEDNRRNGTVALKLSDEPVFVSTGEFRIRE
jgi:hypothetical protein